MSRVGELLLLDHLRKRDVVGAPRLRCQLCSAGRGADVARPRVRCSVTLAAFFVCVRKHTDRLIAFLLQATIARVHGTATHALFGLLSPKYLPGPFEA